MQENEFKGELKEILPSRLFRGNSDDPVANFFLVLAVIYNDLKGLILFQKLLTDTYRAPPLEEVSVHAGEYGGVIIHVTKLLIATAHEFFEFLKENEDILLTFEFRDALNSTNTEIKNRWQDIVDIAFDKSPGSSEFTHTLMLIRNHASFHYFHSGKKLKQAFCKIFLEKEKIGRNNNAYYSIGETMEKTRFFYADAAVEEYLRMTHMDSQTREGIDSMGGYSKQMMKIVDNMNFTILRLLKAYLRKRPKRDSHV